MLEGLAAWLDAWEHDDARAHGRAARRGREGVLRRRRHPRAARQLQGRARRLLDFFAIEYALDYRIHTYPKPIVACIDGIVMGGGMGIAQGAALRIVGERTQMAMPETAIGLFPDVGGSWFLSRAPGPASASTSASSGPTHRRRRRDLLRARRPATSGAGAAARRAKLERMRPAIDRHFAAREPCAAIVASLRAEERARATREWAATHASPRSSEALAHHARGDARAARAAARTLTLADASAWSWTSSTPASSTATSSRASARSSSTRTTQPRWNPPRLAEVDAPRRASASSRRAGAPTHHPLAHLDQDAA